MGYAPAEPRVYRVSVEDPRPALTLPDAVKAVEGAKPVLDALIRTSSRTEGALRCSIGANSDLFPSGASAAHVDLPDEGSMATRRDQQTAIRR